MKFLNITSSRTRQLIFCLFLFACLFVSLFVCFALFFVFVFVFCFLVLFLFLFLFCFVLIDDNASLHLTRIVYQWFRKKLIRMEWPEKSPNWDFVGQCKLYTKKERLTMQVFDWFFFFFFFFCVCMEWNWPSRYVVLTISYIVDTLK